MASVLEVEYEVRVVSDRCRWAGQLEISRHPEVGEKRSWRVEIKQ